jgi:hypothetical protein
VETLVVFNMLVVVLYAFNCYVGYRYMQIRRGGWRLVVFLLVNLVVCNEAQKLIAREIDVVVFDKVVLEEKYREDGDRELIHSLFPFSAGAAGVRRRMQKNSGDDKRCYVIHSGGIKWGEGIGSFTLKLFDSVILALAFGCDMHVLPPPLSSSDQAYSEHGYELLRFWNHNNDDRKSDDDIFNSSKTGSNGECNIRFTTQEERAKVLSSVCRAVFSPRRATELLAVTKNLCMDRSSMHGRNIVYHSTLEFDVLRNVNDCVQPMIEYKFKTFLYNSYGGSNQSSNAFDLTPSQRRLWTYLLQMKSAEQSTRSVAIHVRFGDLRTNYIDKDMIGDAGKAYMLLEGQRNVSHVYYVLMEKSNRETRKTVLNLLTGGKGGDGRIVFLDGRDDIFDLLTMSAVDVLVMKTYGGASSMFPFLSSLIQPHRTVYASHCSWKTNYSLIPSLNNVIHYNSQ